MKHTLSIPFDFDLPYGFVPEVFHNMIRVKCPFLYPDGSNIDVYIRPYVDSWLITDMSNADTFCFHTNNSDEDTAALLATANKMHEFGVVYDLNISTAITTIVGTRNEDVLLGIYRVMHASYFLTRFKEHEEVKAS